MLFKETNIKKLGFRASFCNPLQSEQTPLAHAMPVPLDTALPGQAKKGEAALSQAGSEALGPFPYIGPHRDEEF